MAGFMLVVCSDSDLWLEQAAKPTMAVAARPAAASVLVEMFVIGLSLLRHGRPAAAALLVGHRVFGATTMTDGYRIPLGWAR
ncbi:hypothetical protein MXEN_04983 [Mycobacterium xenopi RIVM700367]|nr:hypothetical protein MXEN_04983 [Mycobacterium xenopi RIVM700367]